ALSAGGARVALAGSAALVAAAADATTGSAGFEAAVVPAPGARPVAVVAGSGSHVTAAQAAHVGAADPAASLVLVTASDEPARGVEAAELALARTADLLVLRLDGVHPDSRAAVARLAEHAVALADGRDLVLTGGETARAVLTRLGVTALRPVAQLSHGAVVSVAEDGRLVATKPGSFGGPAELHDLVLLLHRLRAPHVPDPTAPPLLEAL
ncbi:nucleotide-binding domain containing protein, partial [Kineococcus rubinsiae]|uniref:nucleotide-binding domain containing protein n=1 Tax=Kineococcus rubinsiae TaxID=2609562 RepID=UPI00244DC4D5